MHYVYVSPTNPALLTEKVLNQQQIAFLLAVPIEVIATEVIEERQGLQLQPIVKAQRPGIDRPDPRKTQLSLTAQLVQ